jgi:hypothetical protein
MLHPNRVHVQVFSRPTEFYILQEKIASAIDDLRESGEIWNFELTFDAACNHERHATPCPLPCSICEKVCG